MGPIIRKSNWLLAGKHKAAILCSHGSARIRKQRGISMPVRSRHWFAIVPLAMVLSAQYVLAADIVGRAEKFQDGDTFQVCYETGCTVVRLCGIDAPERNHPGYEASLAGLKKLVGGKSVRCRPVEEGTVCDGRAARLSGSRVIAQCFLNGTNVDIANEMVASGFACDWVRYSGGRYSENNTGEQCAK
jgi:endonuclease YncB( thermonuclease family)